MDRFTEEGKEKEELPRVLFHGTTLGRYNQLIQEDGSYRDPSGDPIWFDETNTYPLTVAEDHAERHDDDRVLLFVRSDMLSLQKPPNTLGGRLKYWTANRLPPKSFVHYNITQDPLGIFRKSESGEIDLKNHLDKIRELCEPLGVVPDYVDVFAQQFK